MNVIKDGQVVNDVIIQEGVLTNERVNDTVAEPVVYMLDRYVVGASTACMPTAASTRISTPGRELRAAGVREERAAAAARRPARRQRAEPLLHVRRDRSPGHARGQLRAGGDRSERRGLLIEALKTARICKNW